MTTIENIQKHRLNIDAQDDFETFPISKDRELTLKEIEAQSDDDSLDRKYFDNNPHRMAQSQLEERHDEQYLSRFAREYVKSQKSHSGSIENRLSSLEKQEPLPRSSQMMESLNLTTEDNLRASNPFMAEGMSPRSCLS